MKEETKILVLYVGVALVRSADITTYINNVVKKIIPKTFEGETIVIPTQQYDTRIECINPQYVSEEALIVKHTQLMKELHENIEHFRNEPNEENTKETV